MISTQPDSVCINLTEAENQRLRENVKKGEAWSLQLQTRLTETDAQLSKACKANLESIRIGMENLQRANKFEAQLLIAVEALQHIAFGPENSGDALRRDAETAFNEIRYKK